MVRRSVLIACQILTIGTGHPRGSSFTICLRALWNSGKETTETDDSEERPPRRESLPSSLRTEDGSPPAPRLHTRCTHRAAQRKATRTRHIIREEAMDQQELLWSLPSSPMLRTRTMELADKVASSPQEGQPQTPTNSAYSLHPPSD